MAGAVDTHAGAAGPKGRRIFRTAEEPATTANDRALSRTCSSHRWCRGGSLSGLKLRNGIGPNSASRANAASVGAILRPRCRFLISITRWLHFKSPQTRLRRSMEKDAMLELYHNDMSTCAQKVRATLAEKDIVWDGHELNLRTGEQHKPQFLKLNPRGVVPVLVHGSNVIIESNIIMEYVEDAFPDTKRLMPSSAFGKAAVRNLSAASRHRPSSAYRDDQRRHCISRPAPCSP